MLQRSPTNASFPKLILLTSLLLVFHSSFCQRKHIQVYEQLINTEVYNKKKTFSYYYIVDSSVHYEHKKQKFYRFVLSEDSSETTGFISFNKTTGDLNWIVDTVNKKQIAAKPLFRLKSSGQTLLDYRSDLGYFTKIKKLVKGEAITFFILVYGHHDSHSAYINSINFKKGALCPQSITFGLPFENKKRLYPHIVIQ